MTIEKLLKGKRLLGDEIVGAKIGGKVYDLMTEAPADIEELIPLPLNSPEGLDMMRHTCAHVMAQAVQEILPGTLLSIGPTTENGFFYDFYRPEGISEELIPKIEDRMREIIRNQLPIKRTVMRKEEAIKFFHERGERLKVEILGGLEDDIVTIYSQGDFVDLCRGPHLPSTELVKAFKLTSISGAYFKGDETREMLTRIHGVSFLTDEELENFLKLLEEARRRDHRALGKELSLFIQDDSIGPGLVIWLTKGATLIRLIEDVIFKMHKDYEFVFTPHVARLSLWGISGHEQLYSEYMFPPMREENIAYQLKPMNCPFHIMIYKSRKRSYKELPIRLAEFGTVYRYEKSGVLHGLLRVRGFTQDDAHIFLSEDQVEDEVLEILELIKKVLSTFGFSEYSVFLSTRPEKRAGTDDEWDYAESALRKALLRSGLKFDVDPGEGVFYGPKIDMKVKDALSRFWQCSTVQLDFNLPKKFELDYIGPDNKPHPVLMIHRAILGSLERFIGVLIEHYAGNFPPWLAPVQCVVIDMGTSGWGNFVFRTLKDIGIRVEYDSDTTERLSKRIRKWELEKVPFMLVVGKREEKEGTVSVRRKGKEVEVMSAYEAFGRIEKECSLDKI